MARPIKDTPILTGEDAKRFLAEKKKNQGKKEDVQTRKKIRESFEKFKLVNS